MIYKTTGDFYEKIIKNIFITSKTVFKLFIYYHNTGYRRILPDNDIFTIQFNIQISPKSFHKHNISLFNLLSNNHTRHNRNHKAFKEKI